MAEFIVQLRKEIKDLILHSSTRAFVTVAIFTAPDGAFHRESM